MSLAILIVLLGLAWFLLLTWRYHEIKFQTFSGMLPSRGLLRLKERLNAYASMQPKKLEACKENGSERNGCFLTEPEHHILLGVLKKVEAKNMGMTAFWIFVSSAVLAGMASLEFDNNCLVFGLALLLISTTPFLLASIAGMRQVDQRDTNKLVAAKGDLPNLMQKELCEDLLDKEVNFRFSWEGGIIYAAILAAVGFLSATGLLDELHSRIVFDGGRTCQIEKPHPELP